MAPPELAARCGRFARKRPENARGAGPSLATNRGLCQHGGCTRGRGRAAQRIDAMRIIDSHFHWWPRNIFEQLCKRAGFPHAERNGRGGYNYVGAEGRPSLNSWTEWFDLDQQLEHMDGLGHQVGVVCSLGPFSIYFSDLPARE